MLVEKWKLIPSRCNNNSTHHLDGKLLLLAPNEYQFSLFKDAMEIFEAVVSNNKIIITPLLYSATWWSHAAGSGVCVQLMQEEHYRGGPGGLHPRMHEKHQRFQF